MHVADIIAARAEMGFTATIECQEPDSQVLAELNLTSQIVEECIADLPQIMEEADNLLKDAA